MVSKECGVKLGISLLSCQISKAFLEPLSEGWEGISAAVGRVTLYSFPGKPLATPRTLLESHLKKMIHSLEIKTVTTLPFIDAESGEPAGNRRSGCSPLHRPGNRPVSPLCPRTLQPKLLCAESLVMTPRRERFCTRFQSVWGLPPPPPALRLGLGVLQCGSVWTLSTWR